MAHLFFPTQEPTLKKPKEPFFATTRKKTKKDLLKENNLVILSIIDKLIFTSL